MINKKLSLSHTVLSGHEDMQALRDGYGKGLLEAGENERVVVLTADLEESTRCHWFSRLYPDRFFDVGVAEQNMAAVAAGMGISGKIPFINSYATFSPGRNWEQIRTLCAYNDSNVKIAGHHAGLLTGPDGATHQSLEDIALMRSMANMTVLVPLDAYEAHKATVAAAHLQGPVYIRLQRENTPLITTKETPFQIGKAYPLWVPRTKRVDVALIGAGPVLYEALKAAKELEKKKIHSVVINTPSLVPLDEREILSWVSRAGAVVSVEEHSIYGGVGSALSELFSKKNPVPMEFIGVDHQFGQSGNGYELYKQYKLLSSDIVAAAQKVIKRKHN